MQTLAVAALSVHAAYYVKDPIKRQQLSHLLAALNLGSTRFTTLLATVAVMFT